MQKLIERFANVIQGCITGFDCIVFKGLFMPLAFAQGAMNFCRNKGILNKDYKNWMMTQTAAIIETVDDYAKQNCGYPITAIESCKIRKEKLAHERQLKEGIKSGLIGVWSCVEGGNSYRANYCDINGFPQLKNYATRCKHLYFYYDHEQFGFMNIRLQTWFPYPIQICLNGREWLRRDLERERIEFLAHGNKFLHIADYNAAQLFLDRHWIVNGLTCCIAFYNRPSP